MNGMSQRARVYRAAVVAVALGAALAAADDWNTGAGGNPSRDCFSTETGPAAPDLLWQGSISAIVAQQAVTEGNLLVVARIFNLTDTLNGTDIVAHDLTTGDTLWTTQLPVDFPTTDWRSRVTGVRDGQVYATRSGNTNASYLYALSPIDGAILWRSQALITETSTESVTFAPDGDVITTGVGTLVRINREDGATVWTAPRTCPTSGGCDATVYDPADRVYIFEAGVSGPVITAFKLSNGTRMYSTPGIGGGFVQQTAPLVGPDGTVYAPRVQNNPITDFFVAFEDTGATLVEKWRVPIGFEAFGTFAVGPDGSVYSINTNHEIIRLDPDTGQVLNTSVQITSDFYQQRMAVDAAGILYVTNGGFSQGKLFSFDPDLTLRWSVAITNVNVGGPAIGQGGILVVCGVGTDVRAYQTALPGIVEVVSVNVHDGIGDIGIDVDPAAAVLIDSGAVATETRVDGVTRLEVTFADILDPAVGGLGAAAVAIVPDPGVGIVTSLANGDRTLVLEFAPALPGLETYAVRLTSDVVALGATTPGDRDFEIRALIGNVAGESGAGPQRVDAVDLGLSQGIRGKFGAAVDATTAKYDVDQDGMISAPDFSCVRLTCGVFGATAP